MHKAREMPTAQFKREVEKELTGKDEEPSEIIYFKLYKSQIPVVEQAIDTAALMLGSDKSRGYCPEMICADFLAGAHLHNGDRRSSSVPCGTCSSSLPVNTGNRFWSVPPMRSLDEPRPSKAQNRPAWPG
jgi:hypothetical protein